MYAIAISVARDFLGQRPPFIRESKLVGCCCFSLVVVAVGTSYLTITTSGVCRRLLFMPSDPVGLQVGCEDFRKQKATGQRFSAINQHINPDHRADAQIPHLHRIH